MKGSSKPVARQLFGQKLMIGSPIAFDVAFELFDSELLITDNAFHHVDNRNYTN
jgi:hypothetical protein